MDESGFSLLDLQRQREETYKDLLAWTRAYDLLRQRVQESLELSPPRTLTLHQWSGTSASLGALEMSLSAIRRALDQYDELIQGVESGALKNTDAPPRPRLTLVGSDPS